MDSLEKYLEQNDNNLFDSYKNIQKAATEIWQNVKLPWFTDHGMVHSSRLVRILDKILTPLNGNRAHALTTSETFILLCSCYLHDIGMQDMRIEGLSVDQLTESQYNTIREEHAARSSELIREGHLMEDGGRSINLNLDNGEWCRALMQVCKSHSTKYFDEVVTDIKANPPVLDGCDLRGDFLCALLMIADELDLARARVDFDQTKLMKLSPKSQLHWYTHYYIDKCDIVNQHVQIKFLIPNVLTDYVKMLKQRVKDKLAEQISRCNPIFERNTEGILNLRLDHPEYSIDTLDTMRWKMPDEVLELLKPFSIEDELSKTPITDTTPTSQYLPKSPARLFTGRDEERANLTKHVKDCNVCMVTGIGGTGKTELVAKYISEQTMFDDKSVFWFDLHQGHTVDDIAVALEKEEMLKGDKMPAQQKGVSLSHAIKQRSCLVIIDNIQEAPDDVMGHLLRHACTNLDSSRIIIIGKSKPSIITSLESQLLVIEIEGMHDDGFIYAEKLKDQWNVNISEVELRKICEEVQNHPLAIIVSLQILRRGIVPKNLIESIINYSKPYDSEGLAKRLLSELHEHASPNQRDLAYRLSVFRKPFPYAAIQYFYNGRDLDSELLELTDGLMLNFEYRLYDMHPLVAAACYSELSDKADAHNQAAEFYCSLRREKPDISLESEIIHHLVCGDKVEDAHQILIDHGEDFLIQGHSTALFTVLAEVESVNNLPPQLRLLRGKLYERISRYEESKIEFTAVMKSDDSITACESKYWISIYLLLRGLPNDANILAEDGLSTAMSLNDQRLLAYFYNAIGRIALHQSRYHKALDYMNKSHIILASNSKSSLSDVAVSFGSIGRVYDALSRYEEALEIHEQSLSIFKEIGDRHGEAVSIGNIGNVYHELGRYEEALEIHEQSLSIFKEIGNRQGEAASIGNIGNIYYELGRNEEALEKHEQSLSIFKEIGDRQGEAVSLGSIGRVHCALGRYEEAFEKHEQSLSIYKEIDDRQGEAVSIGNTGNVYHELGRYEEALGKYEQSLNIKKEIGDRKGEAVSLCNIGIVNYILSEHQFAINFLLESDAIFRQLDLPNNVRETQSTIRKLRKKIGFTKFCKLASVGYESLPDELKQYSGYKEYITDQTERLDPEIKVGRNDPCPCGSGKKYKKCCLDKS
ncbi:MAG: tetratricopeptide repeat protein [Armatimonadota bacterium]